MLNLQSVLLFWRWYQPSSSETEIRCHRCLSIDNALTAAVWIVSYLSRMSVAINANTLPTLLSLFEDKSHHAQKVNGASTAWMFISSWNFSTYIFTHLSILLLMMVKKSSSRKFHNTLSTNRSNSICFQSQLA
jgi:hypothetical protein